MTDGDAPPTNTFQFPGPCNWFISSKVTAYKYWVSGITCHIYSREERTRLTGEINDMSAFIPGAELILPKIVTREELQGPAYNFVRISGKRGVSAY